MSEFEYPGYMSRNGAFSVVCPVCNAAVMTRCKDNGRYMEGYTHIARERAATEARQESK